MTELRRRLNQAFLSSSHPCGVGRRILKEFCPTPFFVRYEMRHNSLNLLEFKLKQWDDLLNSIIFNAEKEQSNLT